MAKIRTRSGVTLEGVPGIDLVRFLDKEENTARIVAARQHRPWPELLPLSQAYATQLSTVLQLIVTAVVQQFVNLVHPVALAL